MIIVLNSYAEYDTKPGEDIVMHRHGIMILLSGYEMLISGYQRIYYS